MRGAFNTLRSWAAAVRDWQQDALSEMERLDDATRQHMAHGAMSGADPLTDSLYSQLEAPAAEGAQQPSAYNAGQQPEREHRGWWLTACTLLAALAGAALFPWKA